MKNDYKHLKSSKGRKRSNRNCDREYKREQREKKLIRENEKLKRQIAKLRKVIDRIDLDRYHNLREIILKQESQDQIEKAKKQNKKKEEQWKCYHCPDGTLRLKVFENRAGFRYYRKCDMCSHRTKAKNYTEDVEGIE